jgi:hypothetical protein
MAFEDFVQVFGVNTLGDLGTHHAPGDFLGEGHRVLVERSQVNPDAVEFPRASNIEAEIAKALRIKATTLVD